MSGHRILVRDDGFAPEDHPGPLTRWTDDLAETTGRLALDVDNTASAEALAPAFARIDLIRIAFPSPGDGRGFTLARHLRLLGYGGRLRAGGQLIADQYAMARRSGFDEVEIDGERAARQPEAEWLFRARSWRRSDYQARLRGEPAPSG